MLTLHHTLPASQSANTHIQGAVAAAGFQCLIPLLLLLYFFLLCLCFAVCYTLPSCYSFHSRRAHSHLTHSKKIKIEKINEEKEKNEESKIEKSEKIHKTEPETRRKNFFFWFFRKFSSEIESVRAKWEIRESWERAARTSAITERNLVVIKCTAIKKKVSEKGAKFGLCLWVERAPDYRFGRKPPRNCVVGGGKEKRDTEWQTPLFPPPHIHIERFSFVLCPFRSDFGRWEAANEWEMGTGLDARLRILAESWQGMMGYCKWSWKVDWRRQKTMNA